MKVLGDLSGAHQVVVSQATVDGLEARGRTTRAGLPAARVNGGRSDATSLLAATTLPGPRRTPVNTTAFVPIQQWSPVETGARAIPRQPLICFPVELDTDATILLWEEGGPYERWTAPDVRSLIR